MYDILIDFIEKEVLSKYLKENALYYPVIIGGDALSSCIKNELVVNDIDIYYVIKKKNPTRKEIEKVIAIRDQNLKDIINDYDLQIFISKHYSDEHACLIHEVFKVNPDWNVSKIYLSQIKINSNAIIDSVIVSNNNYKYYGLFSNNKNRPIPYVKSHGIKKATCSFLMKDVIRCLLYYEELPETPKTKLKLGRYVLKIKLLFKIQAELGENIKLYIKNHLRRNTKYLRMENQVRSLIAFTR